MQPLPRKEPGRTAEIARRRAQVGHLWLCGIPALRIATQLGVPESTIRRDIAAVKAELLETHRADLEADRARSLALLRQVQAEAWQLFAKVKETNPNKVGALNSILNAEQMAMKIQGTQAQPDSAQTTINILQVPEWTAMRSALLAALQGHPEARVAIAEALAEIEGPHE